MAKLLRRTGIVAVTVAALLALAAPGANAVAAPNQTFDALMTFEERPEGNPSCATGEFVGHGVIEDRGPARICGRNFSKGFVVTGTQQFSGSTGHYTLDVKVNCGPFDEQTSSVTCTGQWKMVRAPEGHGDVTLIVHVGSQGEESIEAHYDGVVSCPQGRPGLGGPRGCPNGPQGGRAI